MKLRDCTVMIIPPDDGFYYAVWSLPEADEGSELYKALKFKVEEVTGEPMEHVNVFTRFFPRMPHDKARYLDMFVNGNGHITDPKLPLNQFATDIYQNNVLYHEPGRFKPGDLPVIVGPAVLFEEKVWF